MSQEDLIVGIAGAGGDGVVSSGELLIQVGAHEGLFGMLVKSFGPQIRGGESSVRVRLSSSPVLCQGDDLDVLIAFNWADYGRFRAELAPSAKTLIFVDEQDKTPPEQIPLPEHFKAAVMRVPFEKLAVEKGGSALAKNIVAVGVLAGTLNLPRDGFARAIETKFSRKGEQVVAANIAALDAGVAVAAELPHASAHVSVKEGDTRMVISGNDAFAFGSLVAGCRFFAGYPITPQSEVMEWLGKQLPKFGGTMVQPEDELASISMAIGASTGERQPDILLLEEPEEANGARRLTQGTRARCVSGARGPGIGQARSRAGPAAAFRRVHAAAPRATYGHASRRQVLLRRAHRSTPPHTAGR
jgi:2-oxoglutarate ferredoxin oxidoreductase subunit alpha